MTDAADDNVVPLRPDTTAPAAPVVQPDEAGKRRAVVPEQWQRGNARATAGQLAGLYWYRTRYHGIRLPVYTGRTVLFTVLGVRRAVRKLSAWSGAQNLWVLESLAVAAGRAGHADAMKAHLEGRKTRAQRGRIVAVAAVALAIFLAVAAYYLPWQVWPLVAAAAVAVAARYGKPAGKTLVEAAVVPPKYAAPTRPIITQALGALGISQINDVIKAGQGIAFITDVYQTGPGWGCQLDLPHGVTATQILAKREQLASGLRRPLSATWPQAVPAEHAGRLELWIGFKDISKTKPPAWPLLKAGEADVFAGIAFGTDPRGNGVTAPMFEVNWLIGASPGQGKTAAVRVLACGAALDPLADLWIHELAGKGDLEPLAQCCHRYTSGLDDEAIAYTAESVALLRTELDRRSAAFKKLRPDEKPEGKVTRDMAARRALRLRPLVCFIDEAQNLFMHPKYGAKAADDLAYVMRLGRAYGIIVVLATQRPDRESLPPAIRGIVTARFCLKVPDYDSNDMILGTGSYRAGYNAAIFRAKTDAGLGWLRGDGDPQVIRTYYLDLNATGRVARRARGIREAAGVLTGYALGQDDGDVPRGVLADVTAVFGDDPGLHWEVLADRLAEQFPGRWGGTTGDAISSQCRDLGVPSVLVKMAGAPLRGCRAKDVADVMGGKG